MQDLFDEDEQSNEVPQITSRGSGQPMSIVNFHHDSSAAPTIVKLNGTNYSVWSQLLELHVTGKGKYGYLTSASAAPALAASNYNKWYAKNAVVKGWLIQSMEPDIMQIFLPYKTAKDIEIERVYVFLAGLYDVFDLVRSNILRMDPFMNLEKAFSCVRQEDQQRSTMMVAPTPANTGITMAVRNSRPTSSYKPANSTINGLTRHSMPVSSYKPAGSTTNGPTCSRRPSGLQRESKKAKAAAERYAQGKVALCIGSPDHYVPQASPMPSVSSSTVPPGFATLPIGDSVTSFDTLGSTFAAVAGLDIGSGWIIDSGASNHMTFDPTNLKTRTTPSLTSMANANGQPYPVTGAGTDNGLLHETTCPYTLQQNGVAERKNRHTLEMAKSIFIEAHMPKMFWSDAIVYAVYLLNYMPSSIHGYKTPLDVLTSTYPLPSVMTLHPRIFCCIAYVHILKHLQSKLDPCALKCVLVGFSLYSKGYQCYHPPTKSTYVTMDVTFSELSMYFLHHESNSPLQGEKENIEEQNWNWTIMLPDITTEREEVICNGKENAVTSIEDLAPPVANPTL
ncbi:unnamed protein product [Prunus brigantina]